MVKIAVKISKTPIAFKRRNLAKILSLSFACAILIAGCASAPPLVGGSREPAQEKLIRILPLGDSNTYGYFPNGYRRSLAEKLDQNQISFEFVGNEVDARDSGFAQNHHEGHIGWGLDDLLNGREGGDALKAISQFRPDVILLMAGTNDLGWKKHSVEQTEKDFVALFKKIQELAPNARIVISTILPAVNIKVKPYAAAPENSLNREFNDWMIREYGPPGKSGAFISVVDNGGEFQLENTIDGIHANEAGYEEMGRVWFSGLVFLLPKERQEKVQQRVQKRIR